MQRQQQHDMSETSGAAAHPFGFLPEKYSQANADGSPSWIRFRQYEISPGARLLLSDGRPVQLGGRAFDVLVILLKSRGAVVSKADIFQHVWPAMVVEESNLRFQIASLRSALGKDRDAIKTVSGRGYMLAEDIEMHERHNHRPGKSESLGAHRDDKRLPVVAIIDDDEGVRDALQDFLLSRGIQTETFESVDAFLDAPRTDPPDCLVLDVWLPGMSGIDFFEHQMRQGSSLSVIFISGHADVHMSVRAMKAGAHEFLTKPVRHQDLLSAVQSAVANTFS